MFPVVLHFWHPQYITDDLAWAPGTAKHSADMRDDVSCTLHAINYKFTK